MSEPGSQSELAARLWAQRVFEAGSDAQRLIHGESLEGIDPPQARLHAWALKSLCYDAWSVEPQRLLHGAASLEAWAARWPDDRETGAIARWIAGIAAIVQGRMTEALDHLDAAAERFESCQLGHEAAQTRVPKLLALSMLGRNDEAVACAEQALRVFESVGDFRAMAKIELNLGSMLQGQDRYPESARLYRSAAVRFARLQDREHSIMADIGLANALTWQMQFDEALRINARARMRAETYGYPVLVAHAVGAIGRIELIRGKHPAALASLSAASRLLESTGASPQRVLEADLSLADAYLALNLLPEAVALYDKVARQAETLDAPMEQAWALLERSRAESRLGAVASAHRGLAVARSLFIDIDNRAHIALCDLTLAEIDLAAGEASEAMEASLRAANVLEGTGLRAWQLEAQRLQAMASLRSGWLPQAGRLLEQTLRDATDLPDLESACRTALGELAWRQGHIETARGHLQAVLDRADHLRALLPGDEFRAGLAHDVEAAHDVLVAIAAAEKDPWKLLEAMERGRARALALSHLEPTLDGGDSGRDHEMSDLRQRLNWARARWRETIAEGDVAGLPERVDEVHRLESDWLEAARRLRLAQARSAAMLTPQATPAVDQELFGDHRQLCGTLAPDQALIAFHRDAAGWLACVVTRAGCRTVRHDVTDLQDRLDRLQFQLEAVRFSGSNPGHAEVRRRIAAHHEVLLARAKHHLHQLYQRVWAPLESTLAGIRRVVLIPHRELHAVPFCALHDDRQWLVERFEMQQAPSVTLWQRAVRMQERSWTEVLAVGVGNDALPYIDREIDAVVERAEGQVTALRNDLATVDTVRALAGQCDILHLACHGRFRLDNPEFSRLEMADGPLTPPEVRRIALKAGLVVLSACESGMGRIAAGDETFGLVRAFRQAGADQVLATRWAVDDEACAQLMGRFYTQLARTRSPSAALQDAQCAAARAGSHPFQWAAFVLHG
jgi:tetratricopeptide (TPR) repeat protein